MKWPRSRDREGPAIGPAKATRLIRAARALNETLGDPTSDAPQTAAAVSVGGTTKRGK